MELENTHTTPASDPNALCERCGKYGAFAFDGKTLCQDCYHNSGSCCPEFGEDDLWRKNEVRSEE